MLNFLILGAAVLISGTASPDLPAWTQADFPFVKDVSLNGVAAKSGRGAMIPLDAEFFDAVSDPLQECRILTADGEPVPFRLGVQMDPNRKEEVFLPLPLKYRLDDGNACTLELPPGLPASGKIRLELFLPCHKPDRAPLEITTVSIRGGKPSSKVFRPSASVTFDAGTDAAEVRLRWVMPDGQEDAVRDFDWNPADARQNADPGRFRIRLSFVQTTQKPAPVWAKYRPECKIQEKDGNLVLSFQSRRVPLNTLILQTGTPVFAVSARIFGGNTSEDLTLLGEGSFIRELPGETAQMFFPESSCRYYEVVLLKDAAGAPPALQEPELEAAGPVKVLITAPPMTSRMRLLFGNRVKGREEFTRSLQWPPVLCSVGKCRKNPDYVPAPSGTDKRIYICWGAVLLAAGAGVAVWSFRKSRSKGAVCV